MRPELGSVPGDGLRLCCGDWPGRGAPVIALHGITSSLMSFIGVAQHLVRPLCALDLRGHGDSAKPDRAYSILDHARDAACAMRARGLGPSTIVGHSFGAYVAVALAASEPALVSSLVLVDGGYPPVPPDVDASLFAELAMAPSLARVRERYQSVEAYVAGWHARPGLEGARREWIEQFAAHDAGGDAPVVRSKVEEAAVRVAYYDMLDVPAIEARLASVEVPLVLVRARYGAGTGLAPIVTDDVVAAVQRQVRHAAVVNVDDVNHYTIVLADAGAKRIADLLAEVP